VEDLSFTNDPVGSTSTSLLQRVRLRDDDAWSRLVRLYGRLVLYWCRQAGLQRADRADVFQEVFRSVAAHIDGFRRDRQGDTFRGWLRAVTRSKIQDHFRSLQREPAAQGGTDVQERLQRAPDAFAAGEFSDVEIVADPANDGGSDPASEAAEKSLLMEQALQLAREAFEERTWQAFWRTTVDGVATDIAAKEIGISSAGVRQARSRVLRRLREEFSGLVEEFSGE
jgi:RNA polymerase sigma-70 factor (ECF subfamily)